MWKSLTRFTRRTVCRSMLRMACAACPLLRLATCCAADGDDRTRGDVIAEVDAAQRKFAESPDDAKARYRLARLLYESGDFWRAAEVVRPLVGASSAAPDMLLLSGDLEYLLGRYPQSEQRYRDLLARPGLEPSVRGKAQIGLALSFYQTNRFDRFREIEFDRGLAFPGDKVIRDFSRPPYRVKWADERRTVEVPFLITDPLPLLTAECDGHSVDVLFDTGADMCIVDSQFAKDWGVEEVSWSFGEFGGGKIGRIGYGKLKTIKLANVTLQDTPVLILPTQRFSPGFAHGKYTVGGIFGTALARQFLTTVDYQRGRLVLRERSAESRAALRKAREGQDFTAVPFAMCLTHWMITPGSLNGREGLKFFVDSGLSSEAGLAAPPQTLKYLGIPEPQKKLLPDSIGGGGGKYASGVFPIESLGMGRLRQRDLLGEFGSRPASSYWQTGFIVDGLISHAFLRKYATWTIDFDAMEYYFTTPTRH